MKRQNLQTIVVVGAGLAGWQAIETLRRHGYAGRLLLIGDEPTPPYDRPPLSKDVLVGARSPETTALTSTAGFAELDVDAHLGTPARELDIHERSLRVGTTRVRFDGLILATGAVPRTLRDLEGLPSVYTLRTLADANALRPALSSAQHVVVVGAGFIGSEVAASARSLGTDVTILELEHTPLARVLGTTLGAAVAALHPAHGTKLRVGVTIASAAAVQDGLVLTLTDGSRLLADLVVVGIGVHPTTHWLAGSGLRLENGIVCDATLSAGPPAIYAVGDIANWPNSLLQGRTRVEHWTNARDQGRHAAINLLEAKAEPFLGSNYFWSDQYGSRIQFVGRSSDESKLIDGALSEHRFAAWYRVQNRIVGALGIDSPRHVLHAKRLIEQRSTWDDAIASLSDDTPEEQRPSEALQPAQRSR